MAKEKSPEQASTDSTQVSSDGIRKMLTEEQLLALLPFSRSTLYAMMKRDRFPKGSFVSVNKRIWFLDEVIGWQRAIETNDPLRGLRQKRRARS
jgi:predicted DNA-binding transcriptional regulator AlpA